jgi:hypothetical protein
VHLQRRRGALTDDVSFADPPAIADLVVVAAVETVVRLDGRGGRLGELVLTGDVTHTMGALLRQATGPAGAGFFVVGHFGSGKSHFLAAVGELLADPAATRLTGWDRSLRALATACQPHLVVPVPLVEYRSDAVLEDVVARRAWAMLDRPALDRPALDRPVPLAGVDRTASWAEIQSSFPGWPVPLERFRRSQAARPAASAVADASRRRNRSGPGRCSRAANSSRCASTGPSNSSQASSW